MAVLVNRAKMSTSTTGTGTITLGSAEDGYQTFADAGVANADVVRYIIEDGSNFEIGTGTYTSSGTTLSRTVSESNNSNNAINLSGSATVFIGATADDIAGGPRGVDFNDNVKARFGTGNDFEIYHDGTTNKSHITESGASHLIIQGQEIQFDNAAGASLLNMSASQIEMFHSGNKKLETYSGGIQTTGTVNVNNAYTLPTSDGSANQVLTTNGSGAITFADAAGADLYIANPVSATDPTAAGDNAVGIGDGADATGNDSIAIGTGTIAGLDSVAIGLNAASGTTTGSYNTSIGRSAAIYLTTGSNNTAVGRSALQGSNLDKVTGSNNTAVGHGAGSKNAGGNNNTYLGTDAGNAITSGSSNTFIGYNADGAASTSQQTALGYQAQTAGTEAIAIGNSRAGGTNSFAAAIDNNTSSYGAQGTSSIAMGYQSKSTGNYAVAIGSAQATGSDYGVSIGYNARSSNHSTVAIGREAGLLGSGSSSVSIGHEASSSGSDSLAIGRNVTANAGSSVAIGAYARVGGIIGKYAFANDYINSAGDAQQGKYVLHVSTTNATAIALTSTGTSASATNQVNLQNNSAYAFHGTIVAREKASEGTECAAWKVEGLIRREANAGTTVLVNSATTVLDNTPNWGMALSADTTNGALAITCTGAASTNIRWVATIHTSEVTYA